MRRRHHKPEERFHQACDAVLSDDGPNMYIEDLTTGPDVWSNNCQRNVMVRQPFLTTKATATKSIPYHIQKVPALPWCPWSKQSTTSPVPTHPLPPATRVTHNQPFRLIAQLQFWLPARIMYGLWLLRASRFACRTHTAGTRTACVMCRTCCLLLMQHQHESLACTQFEMMTCPGCVLHHPPIHWTLC